jgi:hypothetical protein
MEVNMAYNIYHETLCPPADYPEKAVAYFHALEALKEELLTYERAKHEEWMRANPHITGCSTEVASLRTKIEAMRLEEVFLLYNLGMHQGQLAHSKRLCHDLHYNFTDTQHAFELAAGYFEYLHLDPVTRETSYPLFNQDHLLVLKLIMLAHAKESEFAHVMQATKADWHHAVCAQMSKWILDQYVEAHRLLASGSFAQASMPGGLRSCAESNDLAIHHAQLLNFVQVKILFYKAVRQYNAAFLEENKGRKKNLRRKAFANFEEMFKVSHNGIVDRQILRDEMKVYMYELTLLLQQNKELTEKLEQKSKEQAELMARLAAKEQGRRQSQLGPAPVLKCFNLLDMVDRPPSFTPVPIVSQWLVDFANAYQERYQMLVKEYRDSTLTKQITEAVVHKREDGTLATERLMTRETEAAVAEAEEKKRAVEYEITVPQVDLFHKPRNPQQPYHTVSGVCTVTAKGGTDVKSQNLATVFVLDCVGSIDVIGSSASTSWVRESVMDIVEETSMLDDGDALGLLMWHEPKIEAPYECPMFDIAEGGAQAMSDQLRLLKPTGSHSLTDGIIQAMQTLQDHKGPMCSKEVIVITDGAECTTKDQWRNWLRLKALQEVRDADQDTQVTVHVFCLGQSADKYLAKTITSRTGGDWAFSPTVSSAEVITQVRHWILRRLADQHTKVATRCHLTLRCPKGVQMRIVNDFTPDTAQHTLLGAGNQPPKAIQRRTKAFRSSRQAVRNGRSLRNGSKKKTDVTPFTTLGGVELMIDNDDIENFVLPIQQAWRSHVARQRFAYLVDTMMAKIDDEEERNTRMARLQNIATRQVYNKAAVVVEEGAEWKASELQLDLLDLSKDNSTSTTIMFDIQPSALNPTFSLLASATFSYRDANGETLTLEKPFILQSAAALYSRSAQSWLSMACVVKTTGTVHNLVGPHARYNPNETFGLMEGDWVAISDTVLTKEGSSVHLQLVDGSMIQVGENTRLEFEAYDNRNTMSEWILHEGQVHVIGAMQTRTIVQCPVIIDGKAGNLLVPPAYQCYCVAMCHAKITYQADRLNLNCANERVIVTYQGRELEIPTLMQTVARQGDFLAVPWTIEEGEYDEWMQCCPNLAKLIHVQKHVARCVAAHCLAKVAEKARRNAKLKENIGSSRAGEVIILSKLAEMREFVVSSVSQLDYLSLTMLRQHARASRLSTGPELVQQPTAVWELSDIATAIRNERPSGACDLFLTTEQRTQTNKKMSKPHVRRASLDPEVQAAEAELKRRMNEVAELFPLFDLDGSGYIEFLEFQQVILTWAYSSKRSATRFLQKWQFLVEKKMIPQSMNREQLEQLMLHLSEDYEADQFNLLITHSRSLLGALQDLTEGNRKNRAIWQLFQLWDFEGIGFVDSIEMQNVIVRLNPWDDLSSHERLAQFLDLNENEVIRPERQTPYPWDEDEDVGDVGHPILLPAFHAAIEHCLPEGHSEEVFHNGIWAIKLELENSRAAVTAGGAWKSELYGSEMQHLITWDLRHIFDGLMPRDIEHFLDPKNVKSQEVCNMASKPVLLLTGIAPKGVKSRLMSPAGGNWWGSLLDQFADGNHQAFLDFLITFPLMSVTRKLAMDVFPLVSHPEYNPSFLLRFSKVLSMLCNWTKLVLKIVMLMNKWTFANPNANRIGGSREAATPPAQVYSVLTGQSSVLPELDAARSKAKGLIEQSGVHNVKAGGTNVNSSPRPKGSLDFDGGRGNVASVAHNRSQLPAVPVALPTSGYQNALTIKQSPKVQAGLPRRHGALYHPSISPAKPRPPPGSPKAKNQIALSKTADQQVKELSKVEPPSPRERKMEYRRTPNLGPMHVVSSYKKNLSHEPLFMPKTLSPAAPPRKLPAAAPPVLRKTSGGSDFMLDHRAAPSPPTTPPFPHPPSLTASNDLAQYIQQMKRNTEVTQWLMEHNLPEWVDVFASAGFDDLHDVRGVIQGNRALFERLVDRPGHRLKLERLLVGEL